MDAPLLIRNVALAGESGLDVGIADGKIIAIGRHLTMSGRVLDGRGAALLPGLHDHHLHLFGLAAQLNSVRLDDCRDQADVVARLRAAAQSAAQLAASDVWLRATGYDDGMAGALHRDLLDSWVPDRPLRVQYRTGSLWGFNSAALARLDGTDGRTGDGTCPLEIDPSGRWSGRLWHGDAWLRTRLRDRAPCFAAVGRLLSQVGVTGVTDASVNTGQQEAALLAQARSSGALPQHLYLMSGAALPIDALGRYRVGPVKIILYEAHLPQFCDIVASIAQARSWNRRVAFHCATATELAVALAALEEAGSLPGDRIEHGAIIDDDAAAVLAERGLTVVTQPAFIHERGERYLREVDGNDLDNLYRCGGLLMRGIPVAGSSDAPYASADPWLAIKAASARRTRCGAVLGAGEAITPLQALRLFLSAPDNPGGTSRQVKVGAQADLCLLNVSLETALGAPDRACVAATLITGQPVSVREAAPQGG